MPILISFDKGDQWPFVTVDGKRLPEAAEARVSRGECVIRDADGNEIMRVGGTAKAGEPEKARADADEVRQQVARYFGLEDPCD